MSTILENKTSLRLVAICLLLQPASMLVGNDSIKKKPRVLKVVGLNAGSANTGSAEFLREDAHPALQELWDKCTLQEMKIKKMKEKEFEKRGTTKAVALQEAKALDRAYGPTLEEIFPEKFLTNLRKIAKERNANRSDAEFLQEFFKKHGKKRAALWFYKFTPAKMIQKAVRDLESETGKLFDVLEVDTSTPITGTTYKQVVDQALYSVFNSRVHKALANNVVKVKKAYENFKQSEEYKDLTLDLSDEDIKRLSTPFAQAVLGAMENIYEWHMGIKWNTGRPEAESIQNLKIARDQYKNSAMGDPELAAKVNAENLLKQNPDIIFIQEGSPRLFNHLSDNYLPIGAQNRKDGTVVFIKKGLAKNNQYTVIPVDEKQYPRGADKGTLNNVLITIEDEGKDVQYLLTPAHAHSDDAEDALKQLNIAKSCAREIIKKSGKPVYELIGMDTNTDEAKLPGFQSEEAKLELDDVDPSNKDTSEKMRSPLSRQPKKIFEASKGKKDQILFDKGCWRVDQVTLGGEPIQDRKPGPSMSNQNPSDHLPISATLTFQPDKCQNEALRSPALYAAAMGQAVECFKKNK